MCLFELHPVCFLTYLSREIVIINHKAEFFN